MNYSEEEIVNMKISKICCDRSEKTEKAELYSVIPVITEEKLCHDESGYSYNSGSFMVMEAMLWNKTMVTTRRLHKVPPPGAVVDMLMRESIFMSRLRHPNILLLVATCQTSNPESLVLLYERVYWGSLYQFLYQKYERMAVWEMCALMRQICSAVAYLHESDLLHTTINSHSIHVVSQNLAKLGNFEYMVENNKRHGMQTKSIVTQSQQTSYLFHWTAPEVLSENAVSEMTDLYSLCAVIWEILHGSIPWVGLNVEEIKCKVLIQKKRLQIEGDYLESPFNVILQQGLSMYPSCRKITVSDLQDILTNIITNRDQITLSQQNVTPKKRTKISSSELKCKNHHRKSFPEQSLRVSFDDTDALMYEPSIKSSTPARKIQSARPAISASPNAPPRRRSKRSPMPQRSPVPQPEDIIQVSISSIEGSQKKTSPVAFPRSLSNESRVQRSRPKLTSSLKPCLSSDHSISLNKSAISVTPAVIAVESNTVSNVKSMSDENSSVVRRSLFQGPQPYKPSPSSLTKVSFRPNTSKGQLPNCSDTSSLTQMPQLTSSSQSNGQNLSNYVLTSPSDSPVVISRQIVGLSRPLESRPLPSKEQVLVEKDGYLKTFAGWVKLDTPNSKAEKLNTPGRTPAATSGLQGSAGKDTGYQRSAGKDSGYQRSAEKRTGYQEYAENLTASARKKAASLSVDQGIQTEGPLDIDHRFDPELKANEKQSWGELPSVQRRINNFQEIADKKKEKEEKFEAFFNKSLSHREGSTTSTPLATGRKEMVVGNLSSAPMVEEKYVRYMSPDSRMEHVKKSTPQKLSKSSSESTHQRQPEDGGLLTHTLRRANDLLHQTCEGDVDLKAKEARDSRIFEIREKHERRQTELETKKSMSDTLLEDYPYSTSAMEFCSRMDHIFEPKTTACSNTTTQEPSETVRICQTVTTTCSSSNGGLDQVDSKHATGRLQRSREPWLGPVSNEEDPQMSTKTTYVDESVKLQEKLAEFMTGSQEDSYFDDVLHPECKEERHLRLQTTLALDQSLLDSEILPVGSPTADDTTFLVEKNTDLSSLTLEELDSPHKGEKLHLAEGAEKSADSQIDEESEAIEGDHEEGAHAVVTHVWNSNQIKKIGQNLSNQNNNALADYGQHQMYRNDSQEDVCESGELHVETVHDNIEFQGTKDNAEIIPINFSHERDCLNEEPVILSFTHTDQFDPTDERSLNQNNNSSTGFAEQHRYGGDTNLMQELENEEMAEKSYAAECSADSTHDGNISEMVDSIVNTTQALHFPLETITEDTDHSGLETTSEEAVGLHTLDW